MPKIDLMMEAAKMGDIRIIEYLIQPHIGKKYGINSYSYNIALFKANKMGHKEIVELFLNSDVISDDNFTREEINEKLLERAVYCGRTDIVKMMLDLGVKCYIDWLEYAARDGYKDIVLLLVSKIKDNEQLTSDYIVSIFNDSMANATLNGHVEIVQMMLDLGANNYNETMIFAALNGHVEIVKMMLEWGANEYNRTMINAAINGNVEIIKMMLELGANEYNNAIISAIREGHIEIVQMMLDLGADDYIGAIEFAYDRDRHEIAELIEKYMKEHM